MKLTQAEKLPIYGLRQFQISEQNQEVDMEDMQWRFGVVGNIVEKHTDNDGNTYYGTKAFKPKTKVYINGKKWNSERKEIGVIGRNRFGKTVSEIISIDLIENIRTQRIYKPHILEMMKYLSDIEGWDWWGKTACDRKDTERFVKEAKRS